MRPSFSNLFNLLRRSSDESALLVVDVGTLFVHVALFVPDDENPSIIRLRGQAHVARKGGGMHAGLLIDTSSIVEAVKGAVQEVVSVSGIRPKRLRITAGGGILFGRTVRKQFRRDDSKVTIDDRELFHILQKIEWQAFDDIRKEFARETGRHDIDVTVIAARVTQVLVDGYTVESPLDFRGQSIAMDIFHVYAPAAHLEALAFIAESLGITNWEVVAEQDAIVQLLTATEIDNAILFDIGGVSTEITLMKDSSVVAIERFAFGGKAMTQRIAHHLQIDHDEAETIKKQYSAGSLSANVKRKITMLVASDLKIWEQGIIYALSTFARRFSPLPSQWFLYGGGSLFPKFRERLTKHAWVEKLPFVQEPTVELLPQDIIDNRVILQEKSPEEFLGRAPLYAVALAHHGTTDERRELNRQLKRVLRLIQS